MALLDMFGVELSLSSNEELILEFMDAVEMNDWHAVLTLWKQRPGLVNCGEGTCEGTPLHLCAETGNREMMELLLALGANPDIVDHWKCTPVHTCSGKGRCSVAEAKAAAATHTLLADHPECLQLLIERGANLNQHTSLGSTPAHWAAYNGAPLRRRFGCFPDASLHECRLRPLLVRAGARWLPNRNPRLFELLCGSSRR
jgi:hypothetical protein